MAGFEVITEDLEGKRMHVPIWLLFTLVALIFFGSTGITQKLSINAISTELSFLWFAYAMVAIGVAILPLAHFDHRLTMRVFFLAVLGGALNGLGTMATFAALEKGGKASLVIPVCYLYPLFTMILAISFLHESLTRVQMVGIVTALISAILLSQEAPQRPQRS